MKLGVQVGLGPGHIVLGGDPAPPPPKGHSPQFSAHIRCSQMAAWIKMPLCMELGLGPGDFVLDGDPAPPPQKGGVAPQIFGPCYCGQTAEWIKMPLCLELDLGPGDFVLDGDADPLNFRPVFIMVALWNRVDHYIFALFSSFFFFFSSPNLSCRRLDVCHTSTHGLALV